MHYGRRIRGVSSRVAVAGLVVLGICPMQVRAGAQTRDEFIAQLVHQTRIAEVVATSRGRVAFVADTPAGRSHRTDLFSLEPGAISPIQLTQHGHASRPRWAPDGETLAWLSSESGPAQIYLVNSASGAARPLTRENAGVQGYEWSPTGKALVYATQAGDSGPHPDVAGHDEFVAGRAERQQLLKTLDVKSGEIHEIALNERWTIGLYTWAADGAHLIVIAGDGVHREDAANHLLEVSVADGSFRLVASLPGIAFSSLRVSPDGASVSLVASRDGPVAHDLYLQPLAGGAAVNLTGKDSVAAIDRMVADPQWRAPDRLVFSVQQGFGTVIYSLSFDSGKTRLLRHFEDRAVATFAATDEGMVYAVSSSTVPMELWEDRNGRLRQLTHLNAPFTGLSAPSLFRYTSTDDFEIEAELFTPASQNGRCPLVVLVHPGPPRRWSHAINDWAQVLVKMGLCILAPNIRGSSGYGEGFLVANRNDWGGGDFRDITAGIDVLVAKGVADPDRLGIAGWSYGGFMSASAVTQTHRFKAAVAQSAMLDLETQWGTELAAIVAYDTWYLGRPWDRPELFAQLSPISHVKNVTTPILLLVGADDVINPPAQNWQFNRALRLNGVETELVIYPREGHTILEEAHSRDLMERMADWLSRHIMAARSQP